MQALGTKPQDWRAPLLHLSRNRLGLAGIVKVLEGVAEAGAQGIIAGFATAAPITAISQYKENQKIYQKKFKPE